MYYVHNNMGAYNIMYKTMSQLSMDTIKLKYDLAASELESFKGGRQSSAPSARRYLLEINKLCTELRKQILDASKAAKEEKKKAKEAAKEEAKEEKKES